MSTHPHRLLAGLALFGLVVLLFLLSLGIGPVRLSPVTVARALFGGGTEEQRIIIQEISEGEQTIHPVGASLPLVTIAPKPAVCFSHHHGVNAIHSAGSAIFLTQQHFV